MMNLMSMGYDVLPGVGFFALRGENGFFESDKTPNWRDTLNFHILPGPRTWIPALQR